MEDESENENRLIERIHAAVDPDDWGDQSQEMQNKDDDEESC